MQDAGGCPVLPKFGFVSLDEFAPLLPSLLRFFLPLLLQQCRGGVVFVQAVLSTFP